MKKKIIGILFCMLMIATTALPVGGNIENSKIKIENNKNNVIIQPPEQWSKTFGGTEYDLGWYVQQTIDGGYIITGYTISYGAGLEDVWLIKTYSNGDEQWNKTFGGTDSDMGWSVQQTTDGGYIITGYTMSYGAGSYDVWLIKTYSNGDEQWNKTFGGTNSDTGWSVQQTTDGGYIITGWTYSNASGNDVWLIKTDENGSKQWDKTFGGAGTDLARSVQQTTDGGYIITGDTYTYGAGQSDVWLIKTDPVGNELWNKTYGGSGLEESWSVDQTLDGGYFIAGNTKSFGWDYYLVKTGVEGDVFWTKTYGGGAGDAIRSGQQTSDGGYIVTGWTCSYGAGSYDAYLIKTNAQGEALWTETFGGWDKDDSMYVRQTVDGGYIIVGGTQSIGAGSYDVWLIKVASENHENQPPDAPIINGPTILKPNIAYQWNFTSIDPNGDDIFYYVDWGDGINTDWSLAYHSGETMPQSHFYGIKGVYTIKTKTKDIYGNESDWGMLPITVPRSYNIPRQWIWERLFERFPNIFPIIRHLMGLY